MVNVNTTEGTLFLQIEHQKKVTDSYGAQSEIPSHSTNWDVCFPNHSDLYHDWVFVYEGWTYDRRRQEKQLTRTLQRDPRIESIEIVSFLDGPGLYKIETVSFAIKGKPGSRIVLLMPDTELKSSFWLHQIGNLDLQTERVSTKTGRSGYGPPLLGGPKNGEIPFGVDISTVGDLVTHYDEVHAYFSEWPVLPRDVKVQSTEEWTLYGSRRQ